ncbi:iron-containing alcohol dehydrogenase [Capsaspora owczarzaki ATCC 30864]|uniref:hydroxyacid-oxoacid transhydrogenase n=2 Tax=Capsaspora owczarzaki (strain ATCC 30864) TaxID=595528 RepID=A0A0D2UMU7_CAPO3|nr:iron-containing alcohol dehydrogenase [Capsaspora owczarzaki ATCC 30864]
MLVQQAKRDLCGCQLSGLVGFDHDHEHDHHHHHHRDQSNLNQAQAQAQRPKNERSSAQIPLASSVSLQSMVRSLPTRNASTSIPKDVGLQVHHDYGFEVTANRLKFGRDVIHELGNAMLDELRLQHITGRRVMVLTDPRIAKHERFQHGINSLLAAGLDVSVFQDVAVEPTDDSFLAAAKYAADGKFDAFVSIGGGSVIDTAKAANLVSTFPHPEGLRAYINAPIGLAVTPPGTLKPHIACPTTSGTGAECTGFAVFDLVKMKSKTALGSRFLIPSMAIVDPGFIDTLPPAAVAASGFDVLSHALESYTARPYNKRPLAAGTTKRNIVRPLHQGSNPYSDLGCLQALAICGEYLVRAVNDPTDVEARTQMSFAATLAGISIGNAGTQVPHGLSYPVSGLGVTRSYHPGDGYPAKEPIIPHGFSVMLHAPSSFLKIAEHEPTKLLRCAETLARAMGRNVDKVLGNGVARPQDSGAIVHALLVDIMKGTKVCPSGLAAVGILESDIPFLVERAVPQKRVLDNAPFAITPTDIADIYKNSFKYW